MRRALPTIALFFFGCTQPESPLHTSVPTASSSASAPALALAPAISAGATAEPAPPIEEPAVLVPQSPGPAYVLVDHSGVLQITDTGATKVFPIPTERSSIFNEIAVSPQGSVWLSDFQGIRVRSLQGKVSSPRTVKDGPLYEHLIVRSENDAWAVSSDIEWNIVHYDGKSWKNVRHRGQFPGKFDDNKFEGLAVTSEGVWISSWNGVWRGVGEQWEKVTLPEGISTGPDLLVYRDQIIVASPGAVFIRKNGNWVKLNWPENIMLRWTIHDHGLFVAPHRNKPRIVIGEVEGSSGFIESQPIAGQDLRTLTIDDADRIWVGTDQSLAVFDRRGRVLMQWTSGTLDGLTGSLLDIAVVGTGPATLPSPKAARQWSVTGQFVTYKGHKPLAGATLALCSFGNSHCTRDGLTKGITLDAQGKFRLNAVPEGQFWIDVVPLVGTDDCETPFTVTGTSLLPAHDCHEAAGSPGVCDLGTLTTCLPFEMPPPHGH